MASYLYKCASSTAPTSPPRPQLRVGQAALDFSAVAQKQRIVLKNVPVGSARVVFNAQGAVCLRMHSRVWARRGLGWHGETRAASRALAFRRRCSAHACTSTCCSSNRRTQQLTELQGDSRRPPPTPRPPARTLLADFGNFLAHPLMQNAAARAVQVDNNASLFLANEHPRSCGSRWPSRRSTCTP